MLSAGMSGKKLNQQVWQVFTKSYGLTLKADAAAFLVDKISAHAMDESQVTQFLTYMAQSYAKISKDRSGMIDKANIELVFNQVFQSQNNLDTSGKLVDVRPYLRVIDAFKTPKFEFNQHKKAFEQLEESFGLFGPPEAKIDVFLRRLQTLKQRLARQIRSGQYSHLVPANAALSPIKSIKGIANTRSTAFVFGILTELEEGQFSLEDGEDSIQLDFTKLTSVPRAYITEGSGVLARGVCLGRTFQVEDLIVPAAERRLETLSLLTHPDVAVATSFMEPAHELKLLEARAKNARFLIMSDVWLDQPKVLDRFKILYEGLSEQLCPPEAVILIGPFHSNPPRDGPRAWTVYQDLFDSFGDFLMRLKGIRQSKFIFVPAASDPGFPSGILPRRPVPDAIFDSWKRAKLDFVLATNPCRIIYFTQEIVITRQDLCAQMRRSSINSKLQAESARLDEKAAPEHIEDPELTQISCSTGFTPTQLYEDESTPEPQRPDHEIAVKAVLDQATLCPYSLSDQSQIWNLEHAMGLYPIPDLLIVAEKQTMYSFKYEGCQCVNPGPFPSREGSFLTYRPADRLVETCELGS